ncbi:hypothetical protein N7509_009214 [Penicillium cosmopolitanum]|uniref:Transcription factor Pcc1 n=1 Tax=Penicillium cosmopolitanum TaxID=1131564 RepID=A0A9X0B3D9_9EURO|nr:uncharacterized protein N7509_009214 [Penicillium cosmopolitanum]KAJ5386673.1 hypothetical protein N7509_009214 [Penicillium cosmopolitanum]
MAATQLSDSEFPYSLYVPPHLHGRTLIHKWDTHATWEMLIHDLEPSPSRCRPTVSHCLLYKPSRSTLNCHHSYDAPSPSQLLLRTPPLKPQEKKQKQEPEESNTVLQTTYRATTNRMLRVAVNGFMESIGVVLGVMAELDVDVLKAEREG